MITARDARRARSPSAHCVGRGGTRGRRVSPRSGASRCSARGARGTPPPGTTRGGNTANRWRTRWRSVTSRGRGSGVRSADRGWSNRRGATRCTASDVDGYFCYVCGEAIIGYEHFREGRCSLFDLEAIEAWEQQMNANFVAAEARQRDAYVAGLDARLTRCPGCRQQNYKLGNNNHVRCWSCNQHFCYACRKVLRRGAETTAHYGAGPGKCRQHSAD